MSVAEIQDNKWELESTKPPVKTPAAFGMIFMMSCFALFFVAVIIGAVRGAFTETSTMDFSKTQKETKSE